MVIVGNIVKVHEAADDIILQPFLFDAADPSVSNFTLAGAKILDPEFLGRSRIPQSIQLEVNG